ncbi:MAG TPA: glycosyltransferase [archaeon]|nr:glycosyltransferase [archaeon]
MSDRRGLFEHALGTERREEHGYCTDDNARLLLVAAREPDIGAAHALGRIALEFVLHAQDAQGNSWNRMDVAGNWTDKPSTEDCWGRSIWALGVASTHHTDNLVRERAFRGFQNGIQQRSKWPRSMAFAALGAAEVLNMNPNFEPARDLLSDAIELIGKISTSGWRWPEPRLTYANALLAEALIASGTALGRSNSIEQGLVMLDWLLEIETQPGHLSVTGTGGRGPKDRRPQFDQQSIEGAAIADACRRALCLTGQSKWLRGLKLSRDWFMGLNDAGLPMYDAISGGGYDGLHPKSVNLNQGAESTLAFVSTFQRSGTLATQS